MKNTYRLETIIKKTVLTILFTALALISAEAATQIDITGPIGSGAFGTSVTALPNGNIVVTDPGFDSPTVNDVGAVYLYNGVNGTLISALTGDHLNDHVGNGGVTVLADGNFVVLSPGWKTNSGAVTFCHKTNGCAGVISASNSLVGSIDGASGDRVGYYGATVLSNGAYVGQQPVLERSTRSSDLGRGGDRSKRRCLRNKQLSRNCAERPCRLRRQRHERH